MSLDSQPQFAFASLTFIPAKPPRLIITRGFYDLSSVNHATVTPQLTPHLSQLLWSSESASAAWTQCPGVDRVRLGPGRLTLPDVPA